MANLLYSAKTADGKAREGFVDAASAREAREKLAAAGLTGIVLHQEIGIAQQSAATVAGLDPADLTRLAQFQLRLRAAPGLATVLKEVARRSALWLVVDAALVAYGLSTGRTPLAVVAALLFAFPFGRTIWLHRSSDRYQELLKAFALGQWSRVAELAAKLREAAAKTSQLRFDLDIRLAAIQARNGDLPGALRSVEPWRTKLAGSRGLFEARLASVHSAAGDREGYVSRMSEAYDASLREPPRALDLALAHARFGDVARAVPLVESLDVSLLPPQGKSFLLWVRGLIALRGGAPDALELLAQATADFLQRGTGPASWTALAFCTCDYALALGNAGRKDEARRELARVWPIISVQADKPLLRLLQGDGLTPDR